MKESRFIYKNLVPLIGLTTSLLSASPVLGNEPTPCDYFQEVADDGSYENRARIYDELGLAETYGSYTGTATQNQELVRAYKELPFEYFRRKYGDGSLKKRMEVYNQLGLESQFGVYKGTKTQNLNLVDADKKASTASIVYKFTREALASTFDSETSSTATDGSIKLDENTFRQIVEEIGYPEESDFAQSLSPCLESLKQAGTTTDLKAQLNKLKNPESVNSTEYIACEELILMMEDPSRFDAQTIEEAKTIAESGSHSSESSRALNELLMIILSAWSATLMFLLGDIIKTKIKKEPANSSRRTVLKGLLIGLGLAGVAAMSGKLYLGDEASSEKEEEGEINSEMIRGIFDKAIANQYPSSGNKATMVGMIGWFGAAVIRGFLPEKLQSLTALNNHALNQLGVFSPTSGLAMFAAETLGRLPFLHGSSNEYDRETTYHHEEGEVYGSIYLVFLMSYLAHFAEQGIHVSPEADRMLKEFMSGYNAISGGYQLDESQDRPSDNATEPEWQGHMEKAERDMMKATTDMLSYTAATAFTIIPTVYGTSSFADGVERKYAVVAFEYFLAKAHLSGKSGDEAKREAIAHVSNAAGEMLIFGETLKSKIHALLDFFKAKDANEAIAQHFSSKLAYTDNILAGLGVDGPCIPVFLKLLETAGPKGILHYYEMMIPNIMKYTAVGMEQLLVRTIGLKSTAANQPRLLAQAIGETIVNGSIINLRLFLELAKKPFVDRKLDRSAAFVQDILARANGEEVVSQIEQHIEQQGDQAFSFDFKVTDFGQELYGWLKEATDNIFTHPGAAMGEVEHRRPKSKQEKELIRRLHAVILERCQILVEWDTHDTDKKREILEDLIKDDSELKAKYQSDDPDYINQLMRNEEFRKFISDHLSNVVKTDSELFQKLLKTDNDGQNAYPLVANDDYPHIIRQAIIEVVRSLRLGETHVHAHHEAEAGREVFGALSGQLVGAAIASSLAHWLLMQEVTLNTDMESQMGQALNDTFLAELEGAPPLLGFIDNLILAQNGERGNFSPKTTADLNFKKTELEKKIHEFQQETDPTKRKEKMEETIESFASIIANIFQVPRPKELPSNLQKIYAVAAVMTPVADNIAAVLFAVATGEQSIEEVFGEDMLKEEVQLSVVPGLPLKIEMTVSEGLIILAAMIGINLGNGTPWGNGVQLVEKLRKILRSLSNNIGDLEIERIPTTATPLKYTMLTNPYASVADMWTIADVYILLGELSTQILEISEKKQTAIAA